MNRYRSLRDAPELDAKKNDEIELELSALEEQDMLAARRLELLPRRYMVVGGSKVFEAEPGGVFEAALLVEQEAILMAGGHIERVDDRPAKPRKKKED